MSVEKAHAISMYLKKKKNVINLLPEMNLLHTNAVARAETRGLTICYEDYTLSQYSVKYMCLSLRQAYALPPAKLCKLRKR